MTLIRNLNIVRLSPKSLDINVTDRHIAAEDVPISKHHPVTKECSPQQKSTEGVWAPNLSSPRSSDYSEDFEEWALETYEWLSLVALESPRILSEDTIDPFLSRYQVPHNESGKSLTTVTLTWTGFIPALWIKNLLVYLSR